MPENLELDNLWAFFELLISPNTATKTNNRERPELLELIAVAMSIHHQRAESLF